VIRYATAADAASLAVFAARTYSETFAADNRPEDMALFLKKTYGESQQAAEIADRSVVTLLVEVAGVLAGFAQLKLGADPSRIEIARFYVDRPFHGRGIAQTLMQRCLDEGTARGARTISLGVWERNERAKAFYRRHGFVDVGSQVFIVGTDVQTDRVMERGLA
jgi:ribosomal protein S18 acetylase RimI-like enzyme